MSIKTMTFTDSKIKHEAIINNVCTVSMANVSLFLVLVPEKMLDSGKKNHNIISKIVIYISYNIISKLVIQGFC